MNSHPTYLGIDQSFGGFALAVHYPDSETTTFTLKAFPPAKYGAGVDRLKAVSQMLTDETHTLFRSGAHVLHICIEGYSRGSSNRREEAGELGAMVKLTLAAAFPVPVGYPTIVPPSSLKQFVTGKGNASKKDMVKGVERKWGQRISDHNAADAYGLARMARAIDRGTFNHLYPYEKKALRKITAHTEAPR